MTNKTFLLPANPVESHKVVSGPVWQWVKAMNIAGHRLELVVRPAKRSAASNALLHAMLTWLSTHVEWGGGFQSVTTWKRLFVASWLRAKGEAVEVLPALDGHGIDVIYEHTSEMTGRQVAELVEWIYCWAAMKEHEIPEFTKDPQTGQLVEVRRIREAA